MVRVRDAPGAAASPDWLTPLGDQAGLQRYIATLRDRWWVVLLALLVSLAAAIAYLQVASKVYTAEAGMLITPISESNDALLGLGLIEASNDPTRDVTTASQFITTTAVSRAVIGELKLDVSARDLLRDVKAEPVAQSSIVTITAEAGSAEQAARIANAFAEQTVAQRTAQMQEQIDEAIPVLERQVERIPLEQRATSPLAGRLAALQGLVGAQDPTIRQSVVADVPENPSSPKPKLAIAAAILAGLILGLGGAFMIQSLDPRLRREEQLRELYRVPILARIPAEPRKRRDGALPPRALSGAALEAYRTLRATLAASHADDLRSRSVLVTGSSPSEGKSTTAMNFANSLVQSGNRVILIEADMHRPTLGKALGIKPRHGIGSVLIRQVSLEDALVTTDEYGPDLQLLLVERAGVEYADRLALPTAHQLVAEAEALADFVVIDSPPLTEVGDTLPLARDVGDILIVVRLGHSKLRKLTELGEILSHHGLQPAGVALVGVERSRAQGYYYAERDDDADDRQLTTS